MLQNTSLGGNAGAVDSTFPTLSSVPGAGDEYSRWLADTGADAPLSEMELDRLAAERQRESLECDAADAGTRDFPRAA